MSPDSAYCHTCFGGLLFQADQIDEAAKEFRTALQLDQADVEAHYGLGLIYERKNQPDQALKEFQESIRLGKDSWGVHAELARIYHARNQNDDALTEIKEAVSMAPSNGYLHEQLADILAATRQDDQAILEYRQAFDLQGHDTKEASDVGRKLAGLYEKLGNYAMALRSYQGMYEAFPTQATKAEYESARARLAPHLPKSAVHEDSAANAGDPQTLIARWTEKSREMQQAMAEKRWKDADAAGVEAIALAQQIQPPDVRLVGSIGLMGLNYRMQNRFDEAEQQYLKALKLSEELVGPSFGPTGLQTMSQLSALGRFYLDVKNYPQAVAYLTRSFDLAQKLYGQTYGYELLEPIAQAYKEQHMYSKAEDAYKKMLTDDEIKNGPSSPSSAAGLEHLGTLYCDMGRYADAQDALERVLTIEQKQFGQNSPSLDRPLNELARALRGLGKEDEAKALDHRRQLLAQNQAH
jgi:tetratricopeptide (TPR) repeat protein